ncbi:MAG: response regulator transcription factor [Undibacterium sp.]|nr:response regulator transcription factor [Opitutaceae bacterium]
MNPKEKISIMLADDHTVMRQALRLLLEKEDDFAVVGQAESGREAVDLVPVLRPDVILLDLAMPDLDGAEATRRIVAANPHAKVLILSGHSDDESLRHLVAAGALGFLEKKSAVGALTAAIRTVAAGGMFFSPLIAARLVQTKRSSSAVSRNDHPVRHLTPREKEVLRFVAEGQANKHVAATLGISIKTVQKHRQHLMDKLNIHETAGLTRYALAHGLL